MRLLLVNMNLDPAELDGCRRIVAALAALGHSPEIVHFAQLRQAHGVAGAVDGIVLGPQGTPFDAYDPDFLPWLRAFSITLEQTPLLAICGGMQALALAWGGELGTVDGGPQALGGQYGDRPRIQGPTRVHAGGPLPDWLGPDAAGLQQQLAGGAQLWQSHAEQVSRLPAGWLTVARSAQTPVEAWALPTRPWLGSQFHPERGWLGEHGGCEAGRLWLATWLSAVRRIRAAAL